MSVVKDVDLEAMPTSIFFSMMMMMMMMMMKHTQNHSKCVVFLIFQKLVQIKSVSRNVRKNACNVILR